MRSAEEGTRLGGGAAGRACRQRRRVRRAATLHLEDLWIRMARRVEPGDRRRDVPALVEQTGPQGVTGEVGRRPALRRGEPGVTLKQAAERACVAPGFPASP
jgi:hypothetical protein